eukprot:4428721-Pleurochrysis_carterae.AAC.1
MVSQTSSCAGASSPFGSCCSLSFHGNVRDASSGWNGNVELALELRRLSCARHCVQLRKHEHEIDCQVRRSERAVTCEGKGARSIRFRYRRLPRIGMSNLQSSSWLAKKVPQCRRLARPALVGGRRPVSPQSRSGRARAAAAPASSKRT